MAESSPIDKYSIQLAVPHSVYDSTTYSPPETINEWLKEKGLRGEYVGGHSSGNGYTNGINNSVSIYMIHGAQETDGSALAIQFPECKLHICKQT